MAENKSGFFWGVLAGAAAVAIAGAAVLTRSFRSSRDGGGTWEAPGKKKGRPGPGRGRSKK